MKTEYLQSSGFLVVNGNFKGCVCVTSGHRRFKLVAGWLQTPKVRTIKAPTLRLGKLKKKLPLQSKSGLGCCCWVKVAAMATAAASIIQDKVTWGHRLLIPVSTQTDSKTGS